MFNKLPNEILHKILLNVSYHELNVLRQTSRSLRKFVDSPVYWKNIILKSKRNILWELNALNSIMGPHLDIVQSINIERVRDSVIHYILMNCNNLQYLTIHGWITLSGRSLRLYSKQNLSLKKLSLFGSPNRANYISVDAYTLGNLMLQSPNMTHVLILCQIHIHAEQFISLIEKANKTLPLEFFTIAFNRSWSRNHINRLAKVCPEIKRISLIQHAENTGISTERHFEHWLHEKTCSLPSNTSLVTVDNCIIYTHQA